MCKILLQSPKFRPIKMATVKAPYLPAIQIDKTLQCCETASLNFFGKRNISIKNFLKQYHELFGVFLYDISSNRPDAHFFRFVLKRHESAAHVFERYYTC